MGIRTREAELKERIARDMKELKSLNKWMKYRPYVYSAGIIVLFFGLHYIAP